MMCYRDRTYCAQSCGNLECSRNVTPDVEQSAKAAGFYIALQDLKSETCGYVAPESEVEA